MVCISAPTAAAVASGTGAAAAGGGLSTGTAILGAGALTAGASILGSSNAADAATQAAKIQAGAATKAADTTQQIYQQVRTDLQPYRDAGSASLDTLQNLLSPGGFLSSPIGTTSPIQTSFSPTLAQLRNTPGYQFNLTMGNRAVENALTSQGLGRGGAAAQAAAKYSQGLAETTYQDQFSNWLNQQQLGLQNWLAESNLSLSQKQLLYNMFGGLASTGEAAAAGTASAGINLNQQFGQQLQSGAASQASGVVGSANALNSGLAGVSGAASNTALLYALNQGGMFGSSGSGGGGNALTLPMNTDTTSVYFGNPTR